MKNVLVIGSGISGLSAAINLADKGVHTILASPYVSERSQSVMAAGGINGLEKNPSKESIESFVKDTLDGGYNIEDEAAVRNLATESEKVIEYLKNIGVIFTADDDAKLQKRFLGGHTEKRTYFSGASTGKQIVTALNRRARYYESQGLIERRLRLNFLHALIKDNKCYGAIMYNSYANETETIYADAVVMATGGQNLIFGKTTGSVLCNGAATGHLLRQGVKLRNLEFIQYHPTSIETPGKKLLITEAARGEGGRLFYYDNDKKIYFMEDKYGNGKDGKPNGNLMPRSVVSREIYNISKQVYLDITHLDKKVIDEKLAEVRDLCKAYINLDVYKEPIPVTPAVHFFMGGINVNDNHKTNIDGLYAVGECASKYHGANRLGGNSLLAAVYSGIAAARDIASTEGSHEEHESSQEVSAKLVSQQDLDAHFKTEINFYMNKVKENSPSKSKYPTVFMWNDLGNIMNKYLGIERDEDRLNQGIKDIEFYEDAIDKLSIDSTLSLYDTICLPDMFLLAKATLISALNRRETRGAHIRKDFQSTNDNMKKPQVVEFIEENIHTSFEQ